MDYAGAVDEPHVSRSHLVQVLRYTAGPPALALSATCPFARMVIEMHTATGYVAPGLQLQCLLRRDRSEPPEPSALSSSSSSSSDDDDDDDNNTDINDQNGNGDGSDARGRRGRGGGRAHARWGRRPCPAASAPTWHRAYMFAWSYARRQAACKRGTRAGGLAAPPALELVPGLVGRAGCPGTGVESRRLPHEQVWVAHLARHHTAAHVQAAMFTVQERTAPVTVFDARHEAIVNVNEAVAHLPLRFMYLTSITNTTAQRAHGELPRSLLPSPVLSAALWWLARPLEAAAADHIATVLPLAVVVESGAGASTPEQDTLGAALADVLFPTPHGPRGTYASDSSPHPNQRRLSSSACPHSPPCALVSATLSASSPCAPAVMCGFRRDVRIVACDLRTASTPLACAVLTSAAKRAHAAAQCVDEAVSSATRLVTPYALEELSVTSSASCALVTCAPPPPSPPLHGVWGSTLLSQLRVLDISHATTVTHLTWLLTPSGSNAGAVTTAAPCLQVLDISFCAAIVDLSPLAYVTSLRILRAARLPGLSSLTWLLESATAAAAAAAVDEPTGGGLALEELELVDCGALVNLAPLGVLRQLRRLVLSTSFTLPPARILASDSLDAMGEASLEGGADASDGFRRLPVPRTAAAIAALRCPEDDLAWIQHCGSLTVLNLRGRAHLRNVAAIGTLSALEQLDLTSCAYVRSLSWLPHCTRLTCVRLAGCVRVTDWTPLRDLARVVSVDVGSGGPTGAREAARAQRSAHARHAVTPPAMAVARHRLAWVNSSAMARTVRLLNLNYLEEGIGNLDIDQAVRRLVDLRVLDLRSCSQLQTLTWLFQLPRLRELVLFDCPAVKDLTALGCLSSLKRLFLSDSTTVQAMPWLASCVALREVFLVNFTGLVSIEVFAALPHLATLAVTHSALQDLSWLLLPPPHGRHFPFLVDLDLSYSARLKDVQPLGVVTQLRRLRLASSAVTVLGPPLAADNKTTTAHTKASRAAAVAAAEASTRATGTHRGRRLREWLAVEHVLWPSHYAQRRMAHTTTTTTGTARATAAAATLSTTATAAASVAAVGIGGCFALEEMDVSRCAGLVDLGPLARLPQLLRIKADHTAVKSLRWLPLCTALTHLDVTGTPLMARAGAADSLTPDVLLRSELVSAGGGPDDAEADCQRAPQHLVWWNGVSLRGAGGA